jgi:hypothetical protein
MIRQIKDMLSSETTEHYCIAFVINSMALLLLSLMIGKAIDSEQPLTITSSSIIEENVDFEIPVNIPETFTFDDKNSSLTEEVIVEQQQDSSISVNDIDVPSNLTVETMEEVGSEFSSDLVGQTLSGVSSNLGSGFSSQSSSGGALDRLTVEIIKSGESKNTNVIWLLDASVSLNYQRQLIADRFQKILQELEFANTSYDIKHGIYSFGQKFTKITKQLTHDSSTLKSAVESIVLDESGIENTFSAIGEVCKSEYVFGSRLLVIVFTDEVGDDVQYLDVVSNVARSKASMVYVVGNPAPFGKNTAQFKFVEFDPKYDQTEKWVEINQGPESLYDMVLDINSLPIDSETLDSGFGPFALSKLCLDTGGLYFSVHPNRGNTKVDKKQISPLSSYISRFFDHEIMMKHRPDYRSYGIQNKEAQSHTSKKALVQASSIPLNISGEQTLRFKAFDEGSFVNELNMAQRFSAKLEPKINQIYSTLLSGESSYTTLEDRWKVSYALAMGRILSTKCRIESYNLVLAEAKTGLKKKDPKSNIWMLMPSKEFDLNNSLLKKCYEGSQKYLKFVVDNYPDTPWALIANEELNTPISYKWYEDYEEPPKPNNGGGGNNNPSDDKAKPRLIPKPQRKIDKI